MVLACLVLCFILALVYRTSSGYELLVFIHILLLLAVFGLWFEGPVRLSLTRPDLWVLVGGGLILLSQAWNFFSQQLGSRAVAGESLLVLDWCVIYFIVSRLSDDTEDRSRLSWKLLRVPFCAFLVVVVVGCARVGTVVYYGERTLQSFGVGDYRGTSEFAADLVTADEALGLGRHVLRYAFSEMIELAAEEGRGIEGYALIGDLATRNRAWSIAESAYASALAVDGADPVLQIRQANAQFEQGRRKGVLAVFRETEQQSIEQALALGTAMAQMGRWAEANKAFEQVFTTEAIDDLFIGLSQGDVVWCNIWDLLPPSAEAYIKRITMYEVVKILQVMGCYVVYPGMDVGATGVETPVDIEAVSGGGGTYQNERIFIGGQQLSPNKRGYNLVAIDPRTGAVENRENFDTWGKRSDTNRLVNFLSGLPEGMIVAGTINDEGTYAMSSMSWAAFERVGVSLVPVSSESHAFIGVVGRRSGTAAERVTERDFIAMVGVLAGNLPPGMEADREGMDRMLRDRAGDASAGIAIYLSGFGPEAFMIVARAH
jgi:hypothetical protein